MLDNIGHIFNQAMTYIAQCTCLHRSYCAIIISENNACTYGYSHSPISFLNCKEESYCKRNEYKRKYSEIPEFFEVCQVIHAEMDVLIKLETKSYLKNAEILLLGIENKSNTIYKDAFPCEICKKLLIEAGFSRVFIFQTPSQLKETNLY